MIQLKTESIKTILERYFQTGEGKLTFRDESARALMDVSDTKIDLLIWENAGGQDFHIISSNTHSKTVLAGLIEGDFRVILWRIDEQEFFDPANLKAYGWALRAHLTSDMENIC